MNRIAIVDDDRTFLELVADLLRERGWQHIAVAEGNRAFEIIKREQPDLILLDIRVEEPDTGWRVLNLLTLDPATRPIPVILSSADWDEFSGKAAWMAEHGLIRLPRPFDEDDPLAAVAHAMARPFPRLLEQGQDS
jgi:CheY-like chemotaxis protein